MPEIQRLLDNNIQWADATMARDPEFFDTLSKQQSPMYLWIGCSDSRVPANQIVDLLPGDIFVHRNVANLVVHTDFNCLSVLQYAVDVLQVKHIIVCGHYGCGGVEASFNETNPDLIDHWIRPIRKYQARIQNELDGLSREEQVDILCEVNVAEQVRNICHIPAVKKAWKNGQSLAIHGFIYNIKDGRLHNLDVTVDNLEDAEKVIIRD